MTDELARVAEDSARGSFFLISGTAIATVIMAVETILFGRLLGAELYGQYTYAFVIPQVFFLLTDLDINQGVTKFTANLNAAGETGRIKRIIKYAMLLKAFAGLILFIINFALAGWLAWAILPPLPESTYYVRLDLLTYYVRLASVSILFQIVFTTATYAFVGLDKAEYNAITTNTQALAKTIISVMLILLGFSVAGAIIGYAIGYVAGSLAGTILLLLILREKHDDTADHSVTKDLRKLVQYGMPLYVSVVLTGLIPQYQYFVLSHFAINADIALGNYRQAANFAALMTVLSIPITNALLVAFSKLDSSTRQKIRTFFKLANKYTAVIVIPAAVLMIAFSAEIVNIVLPGFQSAPLYLAIYCLVYFLVGLGYLTFTSFFSGLGQTTTTMVTGVITFVTLLILSPIFTVTYDVPGLIVAFLVANSAGTIYALYTARRKFQIEFDTYSLIKIYLISAICAVPSIVLFRFIDLPQVFRLGIGGVLYLFIYATMIPLTKTVTARELEMAMTVTGKTKLLALITKPVFRYQAAILKVTKETLVVAVKVAVVVFTTLAFFSQDLTLIFSDALQNETTSYVLAVPFLLVYLIYRKRKMIKAVTLLEPSRSRNMIPINEIVGGLLFLISFLLYWFGSYTFNPLEYHLLALPIYLSACVLILFNSQTLRHMLFSIVFLFLLVPPPAEILYQLGAALSTFSADLAYRLLALMRFPVSLVAESGMPTINVTQSDGTKIPLYVDVACSGIYSQIGFFIFALFMAYIIRDKPWKKTAMFLLGFPLIYFLNILRISSIGIIGYYYGQNVALEMFHLFGGWVLIFLGTLLLLAVSEKLFKVRMLTRPIARCPECSGAASSESSFCHTCGRIQRTHLKGIHVKDIAIASLIVVSVMLIVSFQAPVFALTRVPAIMVATPSGQEFSSGILPEIPGYNLSYWIHDTYIEEQAKQDMALEYHYTASNQPEKELVVGIEIASTRSVLHRWEACLITWPIAQGNQPHARQLDLRDVTLVENPPVIGRYFAYQRLSDNGTQVVLYWYETVVFALNSTSQQKHVKISLIAEAADPQGVAALESRLLIIGKIIAGYWQPVKTWSQIALLLSLQGDKLLALALVSLVGVYFYYFMQKRKEREHNVIAYQKLSKTTRRVIDAVYQTEQKMIPTQENILKTWDKMNGKSLNKEELLEELAGPERIGLIKEGIANREDEPIRVWRTNCSLR